LIEAGDIERVGVVGAGTMGNGIGQVFALSGVEVVLVDVDADALARARETIESNLARQVRRGVIGEGEAEAALARLRAARDLEALSDAEVVVEAATERPSVKFELFESISRIATPDALLATNTSSISITGIAAHAVGPASSACTS